MDRETYGAKLFYDGYNCAQAVTLAFCDVTGLEKDYAAKMASSFGGGFGRLREVCGAVSGMVLVAGLLYGYSDHSDDEAKKAHYALVQHLAGEFRKEAGSIVCREILKNPSSDPVPSPRTEQYYKDRPCAWMVVLAIRVLESYMKEHPI